MLQPNKAGPGSRETVEEKKNYTDFPKFFTFPMCIDITQFAKK